MQKECFSWVFIMDYPSVDPSYVECHCERHSKQLFHAQTEPVVGKFQTQIQRLSPTTEDQMFSAVSISFLVL